MSHLLSAEVRSNKNDADRWLYSLKERYGLGDLMVASAKEKDGRTHAATAGPIQRVAATSARACIECGARSFNC